MFDMDQNSENLFRHFMSKIKWRCLIYETSLTHQSEWKKLKKLKSRDRFSKDCERNDIGTNWRILKAHRRYDLLANCIGRKRRDSFPEQSACRPLEIKFVGIYVERREGQRRSRNFISAGARRTRALGFLPAFTRARRDSSPRARAAI